MALLCRLRDEVEDMVVARRRTPCRRALLLGSG